MAWSISFDEPALAQMRKLDKVVTRRIIAYLRETAQFGEPRAGSRYRRIWQGCRATASVTTE